MTDDQKAEMVEAAQDLIDQARKLLSEVYAHESTTQVRLACVKLAETQEHTGRARYEIEGRRSN